MSGVGQLMLESWDVADPTPVIAPAPNRSTVEAIRERLVAGPASVPELADYADVAERTVRKLLTRAGAVHCRPPARGIVTRYRSAGFAPSDLTDLNLDAARRTLEVEAAAEVSDSQRPRPCRCEGGPLVLNGTPDCARCGRAL